MHRLILVGCLTTVLLSACGRKTVEPPPAVQAPKVPSRVPVVIPGLTICNCRLGAQNAAVVIAKGEFPPFGSIGVGPGFWFDGFWKQFSPEVKLRWRCNVLHDFTGTIEFEAQPGDSWPHDTFDLRSQKFNLAEGTVFVVSRRNTAKPTDAANVRRPERVRIGIPVDPEVAELSRIDVTQLIRPWRDLSVEQLTEAIASDEEIRSLTTTEGESLGRRVQADEQTRPE